MVQLNQVASGLTRPDQLFHSPILPSVAQLADAISLAGRPSRTPTVHINPQKPGVPPFAADVPVWNLGGYPP
jgi:hypothetical protein